MALTIPTTETQMLVALDLIAPGALPEAVARGVESARSVFQEANIDPLFAANAVERERLALSQGKVAAQHDFQGAAAFRIAEALAIEAAYGKSGDRPPGVALNIRQTLQ